MEEDVKKKEEAIDIGSYTGAKTRVDVATLKSYYDTALSEYAIEHQRMRILDLTDRGGLWKALEAVFPSYQILPDTNHVTYIKSNIVASVYTVAKAADLLPTSEEDKEIIKLVNIALDQEFTKSRLGLMQMRAGNNAALHNIGITQIGWDDSGTSANKNHKGKISGENIHPIKFMRDPYSKDFQKGAYCMTYDKYHKSFFQGNKNYRTEFNRYIDKSNGGLMFQAADLADARTPSGVADYYTLITYWVKVFNEATNNVEVDEIHTINGEFVLYVRQNIKPNRFPFAILYCNDPGDSLTGISEPAKAFANSVAYNILDSISATSAYKNQRPPKFVNANAGLNVNAFAEHANDADFTFVVNMEASKAVHYHQFPMIDPAVPVLKQSLQYGLQQMTGVDGRYTGRETGSLTTTGGMQEQTNRVTIIDTTKISNFEDYTKDLTELILANFINYGGNRKYFRKKQDSADSYESIDVEFPKLDIDTAYEYQINISSELPKNRARIAEMANQLMEKQMQYAKAGLEVDLMTPEEWLSYQDIPMKELMLERMGMQRLTSSIEDASQVLFGYADLTKKGMDPQTALMAVAKSLKDKKQGVKMPEPPIDPVAQSGGGQLPADAAMPEF